MPLSSLKQTLVILVVCVLVVLAASYAAYGNPFGPQTNSQQTQTSIVTSPEPTDTLFASTTDWKKQFLTMGSSTISAKADAGARAKPEPETLTGQFGKKFFQQYMYLKQNNLADDPEAVKALVQQTTDDLVDAAPLARVYDVREISISSDTSSVAVRNYANSVGTAFATYMPAKDAATIALQALEDEDQTKIKQVEAIAASYSSLLKQLLAIPAPKNIAEYHVGVVNGVSAMSFSAQGMTKVFTDPIQSMPSLGVYQQSVGKLRDALLDLKFYFSQEGLTFTNSDSASIIFNLTN